MVCYFILTLLVDKVELIYMFSNSNNFYVNQRLHSISLTDSLDRYLEVSKKKRFKKKYFIHIYMPFLTKTGDEWILAVKWQATGMIF